MDPQLRHELTHYSAHLMEAEWLAQLIETHGLVCILEASEAILSEQEPEESMEVLLFIRDLGQNINRWATSIIEEVRAALPVRVLPTVRRLLYAPSHLLRTNSIYTLGKLYYPSEARTLAEAFPWFLKQDPLALSRLMFEWSGLGDEREVLEAARRMLCDESFFVRWAILGFKRSFPPATLLEEGSEWKPILETLTNDPVAVVRDEARFRLAEWTIDVEGKVAQWPRPPVDFGDFEIRFLNWLNQSGRADYSLADLTAFAAQLGING